MLAHCVWHDDDVEKGHIGTGRLTRVMLTLQHDVEYQPGESTYPGLSKDSGARTELDCV